MIIDVICLILALYGFWVGYSRGIIKTVLTGASLLFGFMAAAKFSPTVSEMLQGIMSTTPSALVLGAAFILTFILTLMLFRLLANGLENMLEAVNINFINQILGGGVSMIFFVFIFSVLVSFANGSRMIDPDTKDKSLTYSLLEPMPSYGWEMGQTVWPVFQEFYQHAMDVMDQIDNQVERQENDQFFNIEEDNDQQGTPRKY
jgi:uncharacterized membrane protein required for colicin V production